MIYKWSSERDILLSFTFPVCIFKKEFRENSFFLSSNIRIIASQWSFTGSSRLNTYDCMQRSFLFLSSGDQNERQKVGTLKIEKYFITYPSPSLSMDDTWWCALVRADSSICCLDRTFWCGGRRLGDGPLWFVLELVYIPKERKCLSVKASF